MLQRSDFFSFCILTYCCIVSLVDGLLEKILGDFHFDDYNSWYFFIGNR